MNLILILILYFISQFKRENKKRKLNKLIDIQKLSKIVVVLYLIQLLLHVELINNITFLNFMIRDRRI